MSQVPSKSHQTLPFNSLPPLPQPKHMAHETKCVVCMYTVFVRAHARVCVCVCMCVDMTPPPTVSVLHCSPLKWIPPPPSPSWLPPPLDSEYSPNYTQGHTGTYRHTDKHVHMYAHTHMHTRHVQPLMYARTTYEGSSCIVPSTVYLNDSNHWIGRQPDQVNEMDQVCVISSDCCHSSHYL